MTTTTTPTPTPPTTTTITTTTTKTLKYSKIKGLALPYLSAHNKGTTVRLSGCVEYHSA